MSGRQNLLPFHTFLWKTASLCNLNCSYCYVYNLDDQTWRDQPKLMPESVARQAAWRIRAHCEANDKSEICITFHGGEPLLGGVRQLRMLTTVIDDVLVEAGIRVHLGMQTNGLLFTPEIGDFMLERGMTLGVSLDGPPEVHDRYRVDHRGRPTSRQLEEKLALLLSPRYKPLFKGFLCVVNVESDPVAVTRYFLSYGDSAAVDFLLPNNNHRSRPSGKEQGDDTTPYGDWLIRSFDHWFHAGRKGRIRIFSSIISMLLGGPSQVESLGVGAVDLVVVEANGDIEAVDTLKSSYHGAAKLGYNVFSHDFDTVADDPRVRSRQVGIEGLCQTCRQCPIVHVCGGGYYPHRYSEDRGFDNPSVYCSDLMKLIHHIATGIEAELAREEHLYAYLRA